LSEEKVPIGTLGVSLEDIDVGEVGEAYFPDLNLRAQVYAVENIRKYRDIIVVGANNQAKEHSPVELSYETVEHKWQRVTEEYPLPVTMSKPREHVTVKVTAAGNTEIVTPSPGKKIRVHYFAYSNKHPFSADIGLRFGDNGKIVHRHVLPGDGGNVNANLTDANLEGGVGETLYAYADDAYSDGVYVTVVYSEV